MYKHTCLGVKMGVSSLWFSTFGITLIFKTIIMKKKKIKSLLLSKRTVSKLDNRSSIKGGYETNLCNYSDNFTRCESLEQCESRDPGCLVPTGISACIRCLEIFTEGCSPSFLGQCETNGLDCQ